MMASSPPNWEQILADAGLRVTRQRRIVLEAVYAGGGHEPIGEIYRRVKLRDATIDLSTVYRALRQLADIGIILTAPSGDGEMLYEVRHEAPHHHLVCRVCGKEQSLPGEIAQEMVRRVRAETGFAVALDHLVLWGVCRECQATQEGNGSQGVEAQ